ncbi:TetR/AcrR family transcriptional regulator [Biformimicrobium ophioploci]|uniref:TetR/AcrR family transcriptional regulator n=1 Tax=Biformimicrobium ophioploci TaxID=3036711 RepID=A0ABQ6LUI7_9GAMM|nr:TetR/AcrR family transcriptional regulator [Microbulbifer sp. NKW57]GMG85749.1 TetR/AcrR family transcriptional regulator [Microbulbifer sp. NKW57]
MSKPASATSDTSTSRMDRRRERTRQQLMQAAIELVLQKGADETAIDEVTDKADVGRRTFYNHFDNKEDCVKAAITERFGRYAAESVLVAEKHDDPAVVLTVSALAVFNRIATDPITAQLASLPRLLIDATQDSQRDFIMRTLLKGYEQGRFASPLPLEALDALVSWGFIGLVLEEITTLGTQDRSAVWAHYLLHILGIEQEEIASIIAAARNTPLP